MRLIDFKIINIIFRFTLFIVFLLLTSKKVFSETYLSQNLSMGCKFVFSNYFKNIIKIKENDAIFTINKNDPSILFANTDELDASIQITVRKINNPKSPTITLFMALEKGKREGNFIIPNLRQNLCNGKFEKYNQQQNDVKAERKSQKLEKEKTKRDNQIEAQRLAYEKAKRDAELKAEKLAQEKVRLEAKEKEKQRQEELEREQRLKAEQEKIKKKSEEVARKNRLKKEKERKKKLAEDKARKMKLLEQERKIKLAQKKLNKKITNYKIEAANFYIDIEEFVKNGGNIDLVNLYKLYNIKPNPMDKWGKSQISKYENLRNFMSSNPQFISYERERIGERLKKSFAMKDKSILELEKNLTDLKGLMRKMFGSNEFPKIKEMIKDIETTLSNFNQSTANKVLKRSSTYIASKSPKPKSPKKIEKVVSTSDTNWSKLKNNLMIQQQQFCQLTDRFYDNLNKARKSKNEIKVNIVHKERQENLDALIPEGKISNWIFKVIKIDQVEDGSAAVVLGLQCKSYVGSGQTIDIKKGMSKKDKKQWRATIPYNDRRFRELAKLDQGQFIVGSGTMLEINAYKPGQKETFYASQQIGEHPLTKGLNLEGELFITDLSYIAALN